MCCRSSPVLGQHFDQYPIVVTTSLTTVWDFAKKSYGGRRLRSYETQKPERPIPLRIKKTDDRCAMFILLATTRWRACLTCNFAKKNIQNVRAGAVYNYVLRDCADAFCEICIKPNYFKKQRCSSSFLLTYTGPKLAG